MRLFIETSTDPCHNLAVEETLFNSLTDDCLYLWRNRSSVIIGRNQEILTEVDTDYALTHDIAVIRRITGGGAVYHDLGNINVSYIFTCDDENFDDKVRQFMDLFIVYLQSIGLEPMLTGRNDICVHDARRNLRKISGTAMTQKGNRGLFHLCLLFDVEMDEMERVLTPSAEKLSSKGVASVRSRTINIKGLQAQFATWTKDEFFSHIADWFSRSVDTEDIPIELLSPINDTKKMRYENTEWNYNRKYRKEKSSCMKSY